MIYLSPYDQGRNAYNTGECIGDNPFPDPNSAQAIEWDKGFRAYEFECDRCSL